MTNQTRCGHRAHRKFRGPLTACVLEPHHNGNHVYCVKVRAGIDYKSHALHFLEELSRNTLKPVMNVDIKGQQLESDEECAAIYQYLASKRNGDTALSIPCQAPGPLSLQGE